MKVEEIGHEQRRALLQMTVAVTDGRRPWAFRYSSQAQSWSSMKQQPVESLRALHRPALPREAPHSTRLIVSEPRGTCPVWNKVPESSYGVVQPEGDELLPFRSPPAVTLLDIGRAKITPVP